METAVTLAALACVAVLLALLLKLLTMALAALGEQIARPHADFDAHEWHRRHRIERQKAHRKARP